MMMYVWRIAIIGTEAYVLRLKANQIQTTLYKKEALK